MAQTFTPTNEQQAIVEAARGTSANLLVTTAPIVRTTTALEQIRETLRYDPDTGEFSWRGYRGREGIKCGGRKLNGRFRVMINGKRYEGGQLAWLLYYGEWPNTLIDHKDRNPGNNCIWNLRKATYSLNAFNVGLRAGNKSGYNGVFFRESTKNWCVTIGNRYLGNFDTLEEAVTARKEAENAYPNI